MLLYNRGPLAGALKLLGITVPHAFNVDNALVEQLEEEAQLEHRGSYLDKAAIEFIARVRAAQQAEKDIADRIVALAADREQKALLEEQIRTAEQQKK